MLPPGSYTFTTRAEGLRDVLRNECKVSKAWDPRSGPPEPPANEFMAIWDTGATRSVISDRVVAACELKPMTSVQVHGVHGPSTTPVFLVNLVLPNKVRVPGLPVTLGKLGEADVLIGMDIIGRGDFAVTNFDGKTYFSFRMPSEAHIDFVTEVRIAGLKQRGVPSQNSRQMKRKSKKKKKS